MKHGVNRKTLIFVAGLVWVIAGANILKIGIETWRNDEIEWFYKLAGATLVFALFIYFVFLPLFKKHMRRISRKSEQNCPFAFFDVKGWIVMVLMITMGITIRRLQLLPGWFIAFFYTGLSLALILTGVLFFFKGRKE